MNKQIKDAFEQYLTELRNTNLFDKVQDTMNKNRLYNGIKTHAQESSLLASKIFDDKGWAMSPSHSTKRNKRYRYYLSQAYIQRKKLEVGNFPQIPAYQIEQASLEFIKSHLKNSVKLENYNIALYQDLNEKLTEFCHKEWSSFEQRFIVSVVLEKIVIANDMVKMFLKMNALKELGEWIGSGKNLGEFKESSNTVIEEFEESLKLKRVNKGNSLIIGNQGVNKNEAMINLVKQSFELYEQLLTGIGFEELQREDWIGFYI